MSLMAMLRYTLEWAGMIPLVILNGYFRDVTYAHTVGEWTARQVSCYPAFLMFYVYTQYIHGLRPMHGAWQAWGVGLWWVLLTVGFETAMVLSSGKGFEDVVQQYDVRQGECWPLLLAGVLCLPRLVLASQAARHVTRTECKDYNDAAGRPVHEETYYARDTNDNGAATTVRARVRTTENADGTTATEAVESVTYTRAG